MEIKNDVILRIDYEIICVIVNDGKGSRVLKIGKQNGISGGTIFYGQGTIKNHVLKLLGLEDVRKEIVILAADKKVVKEALEDFTKKLNLDKRNQGIIFTVPIANLLGNKQCVYSQNAISRKVDQVMYQAIFTIVDSGRSEEVIAAAVAAGAQGGTVINGRGAGSHEMSKLFSMDIEPEKEIVLILTEAQTTDAIVASISYAMEIEKPGNGVLFTLDVNNTKGLF
ncbi:P-II family nitrogen regulator [Carnobacterium funditum]|uniref:P-II family nitrogen regulator n=1 Tax=Carnobacterium funditum TaxID=2752 RepID=UPI000556AF88|nr:P-II family nitrogen regulator [Carnobacterium funditum]